MRNEFKRPALAACAGIILLAEASVADAALVKSYDFDGTLADTLGNGADLQSLGGTLADGRYSFGANQGLRLTDALPDTETWANELGFRLNAGEDVGGYNKLIDFADRSLDQGFYTYSGQFNFYNLGLNAGSVVAGQDLVVGLVRSAGKLSIFLDKVAVAEVADNGALGVPPANVLNFFIDDARTAGESFAGLVDFIRIHDDASSFGEAPDLQPAPVPLPATLPLLAGCLGAMGLWARRRA